jgi:hypothetical protein
MTVGDRRPQQERRVLRLHLGTHRELARLQHERFVVELGECVEMTQLLLSPVAATTLVAAAVSSGSTARGSALAASYHARLRRWTSASAPSTATAPTSRPRSLAGEVGLVGVGLAERFECGPGETERTLMLERGRGPGPSSTRRPRPLSAMTMACHTACSRSSANAVEEHEQLDRLPDYTGDGGGPRVVDEVVALERRQCGQRRRLVETGAQFVVCNRRGRSRSRRR